MGISEGTTLDEPHRWPIWRTGVLLQLKSGLTSAPRLPQALQMTAARELEIVRPAVRTERDRMAAGVVRAADQNAARPCSCMSAKVIFCGRLVTDMPNDSANVTDREAAIPWGFGRPNARDRRPHCLDPNWSAGTVPVHPSPPSPNGRDRSCLRASSLGHASMMPPM
jgi:hypothetical protein